MMWFGTHVVRRRGRFALHVELGGQADAASLPEASRPCPGRCRSPALGRSSKPDRPNNDRKAVEFNRSLSTRVMRLRCF